MSINPKSPKVSPPDLWQALAAVQTVWDDWIYVGLHEEFDAAKASALVHRVLSDEEDVYEVIDQNRSSVTKGMNIVRSAREALDRDETIGFCSLDLTRFVAFANVGVARIGHAGKDHEAGESL